MKPKKNSYRLLGVTRSQAKMHEYGVPKAYHIDITQDPAILFTLSIGLLGELSAEINRNGLGSESVAEIQDDLVFAARFFDSYFQSKLNESLDPYLLLMGSASYYLLDMPGSASVLAKRISSKYWLELGGGGLEDLLLWLLQADYSTHYEYSESEFSHSYNSISRFTHKFFTTGEGEEKLVDLVDELRSYVYNSRYVRHLLYADIIGAVIRKKLVNSSWSALPAYSGLSVQAWLPALKKESFISELWPSQHLLGKHGVLSGESAVVQMPTSAGKTKASELILRSAFLSNRVTIAVIVAPFRALCHEIRDDLAHAFYDEEIDIEEVSDVTQLDIDFESFTLTQRKKVLVLTPEKLFYILQHDKSYATETGLVIFDEGHQFDSGTRGVTYELLLTSLKSLLPKSVQKVLVSAVISNAEPISNWLNGNDNIVSGNGLSPTYRTIGLASWTAKLGMIQFVDSKSPETEEFFVPRVIASYKLELRGRERIDRFFPSRNEGKDIALHLGLNLCPNGSVAIFCGTKVTAVNLCKRLCDVIFRNAPHSPPVEHSDPDEVARLANLYALNLGEEAPVSQSAKLGVFTHHANTPHGIRLAVEYSMSKNLVCFVICTSTLAQGVNLPLRYLIITSVYQAGEKIKVRDFHNLVGRAGRSGMHTEGSIIFADPEVYDNKLSLTNGWRWRQVKELLDSSNSEPCISNILSIFDPLTDDRGRDIINWDTLVFFRQYLESPDELDPAIEHIAERFSKEGATKKGISRQIMWRIKIVSSIESFLLTHREQDGDQPFDKAVKNLASQTLAYYMAEGDDKQRVLDLFKIIAENVYARADDPKIQEIYGRTMLGVHSSELLQKWVEENQHRILTSVSDEDVVGILVDLYSDFSFSATLGKLTDQGLVSIIIHSWLNGETFNMIYSSIHNAKAKLISGRQLRNVNIEHVVQICENELAYEGSLIVGALCEFVAIIEDDLAIEAETRYRFIQKRLKYGLPSIQAVTVYELGISDRVIVRDMLDSLNLISDKRSDIIDELKAETIKAEAVIHHYPIYYWNKLNEIITN